tara:strand:+ start:1098 stop:1799 length:702 start_codon:yes stop_codon:yes gene_type:complete
MVKKREMSPEGKKFLDKVKNVFGNNYNGAAWTTDGGWEDTIGKVDTSSFTPFDWSKIHSYATTQTRRDLQRNEKALKSGKYHPASQWDDSDHRVSESTKAIKYMYEHGDKLEAKEWANKISKIADSRDLPGTDELYKAARMDKGSRKEKLKQLRENRPKEKLEQSAESSSYWTILTFAGIGIGALFLSPNLTGNAIGNLSTNTTSWVGGVLLAIGLVAGFSWINNRKKSILEK